MREITIGIVGTGRIGRIHATNLTRNVPGARVAAVADLYVDRAAEWVEELGIAATTTDYRDLLRDPEIDAIYVCSNTDTHAMILTDAARAGKDVFCEKPIDLSVEKVDDALRVVQETGVLLQIGFNRRFDPNFAAVQRRVAAGDVGQVDIVKITSRDPEPPPIDYVRTSGGIFPDMTIHDFDMARFLSGSEVVAVHAAGAVRVEPAIGDAGDIDTAIVTLRFENGAIGVIDNSRQAVYGYDQRIEVFGRNGMLRAENETQTRVEYAASEGVSRDKPLYFFLERYADAFAAESRAFVAAIRDRTVPPVTGDDGLQPLLIGMAAKRSLDEGRTVTIKEIRG